MALMNFNIGSLMYSAIGSNTIRIKAMRAIYSVATSINRCLRISTPICPTV
ncbi:hypothetical protein D3C85_1925550 [compost metagenome]